MELTNQTYLRSRVDMQLADSLRMKASNKISAGVLGNARENSGGFSAGIRSNPISICFSQEGLIFRTLFPISMFKEMQSWRQEI